MKYVMLLYTDRESIKAEKLKDYLQGRLRNMADLRSIGEISAEEGNFRSELRGLYRFGRISPCFVPYQRQATRGGRRFPYI